MPDIPTPTPPSAPAAAGAKIDPKVMAGLILIGASVGVFLGMKIAKIMSPPKLPARAPCPDCEQRKLNLPAPVVVPRVAPTTTTPPPDDAPLLDEPQSTPVVFSAQAIPTDDA